MIRMAQAAEKKLHMETNGIHYVDAPAARRVKDPRVLDALRAVPRERFADSGRWSFELPPDSVAQIVEDLRISKASRVLVVGARSGYLPAVLGHLAASVHVVDPDLDEAEAAREKLTRFAPANVSITVGSAEDGLPEQAPFDSIAVLVPVPDVPLGLIEQLAPEGRLTAALDPGQPPRRIARLVRSIDGTTRRDDYDGSRFLPLLGDLLVVGGLLPRAVVEDAAQGAFKAGRHLGQELLERGALTEEDLYRALAQQHSIAFGEADKVLESMDRELAKLLPKKFLERHSFVPVRREGRDVVVATTNPALPLWDVTHALQAQHIVLELVTPIDLRRIRIALDLGHVAPLASKPARPALPSGADLYGLPASETSHASATLDALLVDAISERASDIHLECYEGVARVRFRVDGSLREVGRYQLGSAELSALINVIKIEAKLDIAERRAPQSGRTHRRAGEQTYGLRVQTQPSLHGEHVVIRLLQQDAKPLSIESLGMPAAMAARYRRLLLEPHGLLLVVGPTGSGKSTTLYAGLQLLAGDVTRKVITVEDPIEYSTARVQQTQVNPAVGFHFAEAVRAFVRQDPDVILVGEIRDGETALEALRASQTGHLVLSTLHCNDAVDAVQRLLDLGMHPNSIASEISAVMAQRLARRICDGCRAPAEPDPVLAAELFPDGVPSTFQFFAGKGCGRCGGTGTKGRVAVIEFLPVGPEMRKAISRHISVDDLRDLAYGADLVPLRDSALELLNAGVIPLSEILDVLSSEQMAPHGSARPV